MKHIRYWNGKTSRVYAIDVYKVSNHNGIDLWAYTRTHGTSQFVSKVSISLSPSVNRVHERKYYFDYPLFP